jgi:threonine dehydrogenase-like Zn-dependent dehydrogenase
MAQCLTIKGQFAQSRDDTARAIRLIESGNLTLRKEVIAQHPLEEHEEALKLAANSGGWKKLVLFTPK